MKKSMPAYREISRCRICGNKNLIPVLSLGCQALTGVFPKRLAQHVTSGPVDLVKCDESSRGRPCGLLQLQQSYSPAEMYGDGYGYHSSLNQSMVDHLRTKVRKLVAMVDLSQGDLILDIGSNDATLLKSYPPSVGLSLVGVDPAGSQFRRFYPPHIQLIADYFSAQTVRRHVGGRKAKLITSIAMFYDLEAPLEFVRQVSELLADDGMWVLEQSYMPLMLKANAYDTICHEHLEYYGLRQIKWMTDAVGLKIVDVELNAVNGGSFSVVVAKSKSKLPESRKVESLLRQERLFSTERPFMAFRDRVLTHRDALLRFFEKSRSRGESILGYGASTKGNVILQFCGLTAAEMPRIGEVNPRKFGSYTPGTHIPIVPEREVKAERPDYLLVLPWHFKDFILKKESSYRRRGGKFLFPLPRLEVH